MKEDFRNETEKLRNNEPNRYVSLPSDFENRMDELCASITDLRNRQYDTEYNMDDFRASIIDFPNGEGVR